MQMPKRLRVGVLFAGAFIVFSAGFAAGQRSGPMGDRLVEQTLLTRVELAKAIGELGDRELRLSEVKIAPHGYIGLHGHEDDPTVVYVLTGVITNHHDDGTTNEVQAGQAFAEFGPKSHWIENKGSMPAAFVFASVSRRQ
jgi:quercetin dioxygenase-like cupin family protein